MYLGMVPFVEVVVDAGGVLAGLPHTPRKCQGMLGIRCCNWGGGGRFWAFSVCALRAHGDLHCNGMVLIFVCCVEISPFPKYKHVRNEMCHRYVQNIVYCIRAFASTCVVAVVAPPQKKDEPSPFTQPEPLKVIIVSIIWGFRN